VTALTADFHRQHTVHQPQFLPLPVKAGARIYLNAIVGSNAGKAVPAASGLRVMGIARTGFDNTTGADGTLGASSSGFGAARVVEVDTKGEWEIAVTGSVPSPGDNAYVEDDNTVSKTPSESYLGQFTHPGSSGKWFVDLGAPARPVVE